MQRPRSIFFCELESEPLLEILETPGVIGDLLEMKAGLSLALIDLSPDRAQVVRVLNEVGIPVIAWLVLDVGQGYYLNMDNHSAALARYAEFKQWSVENNLNWEAIGLDIEPDIQMIKKFAAQGLRALPKLAVRGVGNILNWKRFRQASTAYRNLVKQIHVDGYPVESYQFPILADERSVRTTLIQRLTGIVDMRVDREVWMLYSTFFQHRGVGFLWSYASQAEAIGVGITGGGIEIDNLAFRSLSWVELARDLRLAWYWTDHLYIYSLEGCVRQGYLVNLKSMLWDQPILFPDEAAARVDVSRRFLQSFLWLSKNLLAIIAGVLGIYILIDGIRRYSRNPK